MDRLFAKAFYKSLGIGGGCSLLAGAATVLLPFLWLLIHYSPQIRTRSTFASSQEASVKDRWGPERMVIRSESV